LHAHGETDIQTTKQAAEALRPLAGRFAATLFTLGVVGVGLLAIPTLTGSAAYAFAETFAWREGLDKKLQQARSFYAVILLSTIAGVALDFTRISPVKALYWTAVINGLIAPFLLVVIMMVAMDEKLMSGQPSPRWAMWIVGLTTMLMFIAGIAMFVM
jgi:Mn2+/Fe2+ NRAMP family transporter